MIGQFDEKNPSSIDKKKLVEYIQEGIIEYKGFTDDVRSLISQSDCIVLPSYREAIARSLTEAMAMGKPVIATDTAGCREAVEPNKNGFLVPVGEVDALSKSILMMKDLEEEERKKFGEYSRKKAADEFDDRKIAKEIYHIAEMIIHKDKSIEMK